MDAALAPPSASSSKVRFWMTWTGYFLSGLVVCLFVFSASMVFSANPEMLSMMTGKYGFPEGSHLVFGAIEVLCIVLYVVPRTNVLGAILLTAYLGGAVCTHMRIQEPVFFPILCGAAAWGGIFLRDERLRALMPIRMTPAK